MVNMALANCHRSMGDLQDPIMEVLYHIRPYFVGIGYSLNYIGLTS
jgi:hypothetical protein